MQKTHFSAFAIAMAFLTATAAHAQVTVQDAWVRASVPNQKATGAFMRLSAAKNTRLVSVSSPAAPLAEIHEMKVEGDVMKMREVPAIELPAGKAVDLKPGGYHVMLMDLPKPVKEGDTVPLTLVFEGQDGKRESLEVKAQARAVSASQAPAGHDEHKH
ncbi:copper chaperone PCu(A)C [Acidovorax sp. NCPPB 3576]|uniref:copper chaperone PCu(A)C n=1 Tax=Acidovorax sp. NCPPB 3576 TaxID=2940488 RepID=UPI002349BF9D|nr:copper chaperone PCu(A)C [Acidovorax sp. NCPPB 3576]WCM87079.1 copper chaperone PCu(A)C [Acidovorax sp. NCPPB 3576]